MDILLHKASQTQKPLPSVQIPSKPFQPLAPTCPTSVQAPTDELQACSPPGHAQTEISLSFPDKTRPVEPQRHSENDRQLDQLLQTHAQLRLQLQQPNLSPAERQRLQTALQGIETDYRQQVIQQAPTGGHARQLGLGAYLADLGALSPELAQSVSAADSGGALPSTYDISRGLNFPVGILLSERQPGPLSRLSRILTDIQAGKTPDAESLEQLKHFGFYYSGQHLVNLLNHEQVNAAALAHLIGLSRSAADGVGPMGSHGLPAFRALGEVAKKMAAALGDVEALNQERGKLDQLVADLAASRQAVQLAAETVGQMKQEQSRLQREYAASVSEDQLLQALTLAQPARASELNVPPELQASWEQLLVRHHIQRIKNPQRTVYRCENQTFATPDALLDFLRQDLRARLNAYQNRLQALDQRLATARNSLSQSTQNAQRLLEQVQTQSSRVQAAWQKSTASQEDLARMPSDTTLWNSLPSGLRFRLEVQMDEIRQRWERAKAQTEQALKRADATVRETFLTLGKARQMLGDTGCPPASSSSMPQPQTGDGSETSNPALASLPAASATTDREAASHLAQALKEVGQKLNDIQTQQRQTQLLAQRFSAQQNQRLRSEQLHHRATLEQFDLRRRVLIQTLLDSRLSTG